MVHKKIVEVLNLAKEIEKEGILSYLDIARRTKDISGKNMFITLAQEEVSHYLALEKEVIKFLEEGHSEHIEIPVSEIEKVAPEITKREKRKKGKSELNELDALEIALEQEKKSMEFYKSKMEEMEDENLKALFKRLYEMEQNHYDLIFAQLDYIKGTGFWFDIPEFSMEA